MRPSIWRRARIVSARAARRLALAVPAKDNAPCRRERISAVVWVTLDEYDAGDSVVWKFSPPRRRPMRRVRKVITGVV